MPKEQQVPVLIIGAGPVGLAAALELRRRGRMVRIVDREEGPSTQSKAMAVNPRSLALLDASGVSEKLLVKGMPVERLGMYRRDRLVRTLELDVPARPSAAGSRMLVISQRDTELVLIDALRERGVEVDWGTELRSLTLEPNAALVELVRHDARGLEEIERVRADWVLGADGAHSKVRQTIGFGFLGERDPEPWSLADVRLEPALPTELSLLFGCGPQQRSTIVAIAFGDTYVVGSSGGWTRVAGRVPDVVACLPSTHHVEEVGWVSQFNVSYRVSEGYRCGRVLLAGDAAHVHSPVGARGMNLGIEDACAFAEALASNEPDAALTRYARERRAKAERVVGFVRLLTRVVTHERGVLAWLRDRLLPNLLWVPMIRRALLRRITEVDR